jgi:hypothetical protein
MFARTALIAAFVFAASDAHAAGGLAAGDLHDLYDALQTKGRSVTIPAKVLGRLRLGVPASDISGKEIIVTETDRGERGITAFKLAGIPCMTMFHVEADKDDSWLIRFSLDGRILNQEWEEGGYRTYEIQSPQVAEQEIAFWRQRMAGRAAPRAGVEK